MIVTLEFDEVDYPLRQLGVGEIGILTSVPEPSGEPSCSRAGDPVIGANEDCVFPRTKSAVLRRFLSPSEYRYRPLRCGERLIFEGE